MLMTKKRECQNSVHVTKQLLNQKVCNHTFQIPLQQKNLQVKQRNFYYHFIKCFS